MERYILKDNEARSRYEFDLGGHTAYIDYEKDNGTIVLTHTFVPEAYEGRGVGAQLVAAALADIRRQGLKVVPQCSFVAVYIKRHPEWSDMVSETAGAFSALAMGLNGVATAVLVPLFITLLQLLGVL